MLAGDTMGYKIDRYQHSLQTASRAFAMAPTKRPVVCALLHDIGDTLAPENMPSSAPPCCGPISPKTIIG